MYFILILMITTQALSDLASDLCAKCSQTPLEFKNDTAHRAPVNTSSTLSRVPVTTTNIGSRVPVTVVRNTGRQYVSSSSSSYRVPVYKTPETINDTSVILATVQHITRNGGILTIPRDSLNDMFRANRKDIYSIITPDSMIANFKWFNTQERDRFANVSMNVLSKYPGLINSVDFSVLKPLFLKNGDLLAKMIIEPDVLEVLRSKPQIEEGLNRLCYDENRISNYMQKASTNFPDTFMQTALKIMKEYGQEQLSKILDLNDFRSLMIKLISNDVLFEKFINTLFAKNTPARIKLQSVVTKDIEERLPIVTRSQVSNSSRIPRTRRSSSGSGSSVELINEQDVQ